MPNAKGTALPVLTSLSPSDLLYVIDDPGGVPLSSMVPASVVASYLHNTIPVYINAGAALSPLLSTDVIPIARPLDTTQYKATMAEVATEVIALADTAISMTNAYRLDIHSATAANIFRQCSTEVDFSGTPDPVYYWGWNVQAGGSRINGALPAIYQQYEADYLSGGIHYQEWSFNIYCTDAPGAKRYMAFANDIANHNDAYWFFYIGNAGNSQFAVIDDATGAAGFIVNPGGVVQITKDLIFNTRFPSIQTYVAGGYLDIAPPTLFDATVQFSDDVKIQTALKGPIILDRADGNRYRIKVTNGVLGTEVA
jgi:hypothetical protein